MNNILKRIINTKDYSNKFNKEDVNINKNLAVLSYLGPLLIVPFLKKSKSSYLSFHVEEGLNLLIYYIIYFIVEKLLYSFKTYLNIILVILLVLSLISVINTLNGKSKTVPIVNNYYLIKK